MDYLEFIFQDFWHFIGTALLLSIVFGGIGRLFNKKVEHNYENKNEKIEGDKN